ncbi:alpha/beta fold hydrolase [Lyngbya confervoides]|uniref:Alpha/beta hydrolase n=1 Tax=Lyngbya confervoides BDU141951 TaxID=1574623 RepID=A0ABD4T0M8_9CYAN|nr:alpha/beta hydrolase [Lyngbya confervoides]MCM1982209.1 alpha/beta hydrolase [Lyngbya confervoides BDU141951]
MARIDLLGVSHHYELTPPPAQSDVTLVFIHGWLLSRSYWSPMIQRLAGECRCLSYDLRGFGRSQVSRDARNWACDQQYGLETMLRTDSAAGIELGGPTNFAVKPPAATRNTAEGPWNKLFAQRCRVSPFTPASFARDLLVLLDKLEIQRPWLVGHSLGGAIAIWTAALCDRVVGVTCLNSGGGIYIEQEFAKFRGVGQRLLNIRPPILQYLPGMDWVFSRMNVADPVARQWGKQQIIDFVSADAEAARGALLDSTQAEEVLLLPRLVQGLGQPIFFIAGQRDPVMNLKYVYHLASFHPLFQGSGANVIEIPNCGHLGMIEHPTSIAEHLCQMMAQHTPATRTQSCPEGTLRS